MPDFRPRALPFVGSRRSVTVTGSRSRVATVEFGAVSMGNPHAVIAVESVAAAAPSSCWARLCSGMRAFRSSVNVGFMERQSERRIRLRVFERGVGETLACGTGAAAAVAVGRRWGWLGEKVEVELPGGVLEVNWPGPGAPLWQTGPTTAVYEGYIEL